MFFFCTIMSTYTCICVHMCLVYDDVLMLISIKLVQVQNTQSMWPPAGIEHQNCWLVTLNMDLQWMSGPSAAYLLSCWLVNHSGLENQMLIKFINSENLWVNCSCYCSSICTFHMHLANTAGDLTDRHMDVFKCNSYFKGVNIPVPETNVIKLFSCFYYYNNWMQVQ